MDINSGVHLLKSYIREVSLFTSGGLGLGLVSSGLCLSLKNLVLFTSLKVRNTDQSCPWVGLTRGLGRVGSGIGRKFVFSGLGWVMGLKWQVCEKYMSRIYVTLCRVSTGKFVL